MEKIDTDLIDRLVERNTYDIAIRGEVVGASRVSVMLFGFDGSLGIVVERSGRSDVCPFERFAFKQGSSYTVVSYAAEYLAKGYAIRLYTTPRNIVRRLLECEQLMTPKQMADCIIKSEMETSWT
jgi:hypothetical protein